MTKNLISLIKKNLIVFLIKIFTVLARMFVVSKFRLDVEIGHVKGENMEVNIGFDKQPG